MDDTDNGKGMYKSDVSLCADEKKLPSDALDIARFEDAPDDKSLPPEALKEAKTSLVKAGGVTKAFTTVGKAALGPGAIALGAAFVIIDFIDHKWVGAAIGGVGLAAGVAIGFAVGGPVGWIIGGIITALFASMNSRYSLSSPP